VYAAIKGWGVAAFDFSEEGKKKALALAGEYEVDIDYQIQDATDFKSDKQYDAIALIFAHFNEEDRKILFHNLEECLSPDGRLIIEVFSKSQMGRDSGGPKDLNLLYSKDEIEALFPNINFMILEETKISLDEGMHHQGDAAVIRAVGVRK